jgi:hypothetical protein
MRETVSNIDAKQAYAAIIRQKIKYGNYHKVLFHVHTPASYDYHLLKEWGVKTYQQKTTEDVINVFSNFSGIHCNFSKNNGDKSIPKVFVSEKELWSYLLLGEGLCKNNIELVVVADHHTIDGILKLQTAISELNKKKTLKIYPEVIGGVEISCADRLHVVGIFDASNIVIQQKISQWLQDNLIDEESGVFETSLEVMHQLKEFEAIPYIAHINTSDIFKKEKYLSGAYRKKIFGSEFLRIIGISSANMKISTMQQIENVSESIKKDKINFVIDNDAHDIQGLERNSFWIKGEKRNFFMLQEALENYDISVSLSVSNHSHTYIKPGFSI